jgi:hypothetical protein
VLDAALLEDDEAPHEGAGWEPDPELLLPTGGTQVPEAALLDDEDAPHEGAG